MLLSAKHSVNKKWVIKTHELKILNQRNFQNLPESQQFLDALFVGLVNGSEVSQVAFLLFGLLGENVAFESVFSLDFS